MPHGNQLSTGQKDRPKLNRCITSLRPRAARADMKMRRRRSKEQELGARTSSCWEIGGGAKRKRRSEEQEQEEDQGSRSRSRNRSN